MDKKVVLEAKVWASVDGERLNAPYRMILKRKGKSLLIGPEQSFDGVFNEYSGLPCWNLETVLHCDTLAIDFGQKWFIHNVQEAVNEALRIILKEEWVYKEP